MPWTTNENGEKQYIVSRYDKNELPTWNEIYNEWYLNKFYQFDRKNDTALDPYWKIPKKLFLLAVMCNQFNKMLNEDTDCDLEKQAVNKYIRDNYLYDGMDVSQVTVRLYDVTDGAEEDVASDIDLPIYHIPFANGKPNEFISDWSNRVDVNKHFASSEGVKMKIVCTTTGEPIGGDLKLTVGNTIVEDMTDEFVECLMPRFKEYFKEPIGWKDENHEG